MFLTLNREWKKEEMTKQLRAKALYLHIRCAQRRECKEKIVVQGLVRVEHYTDSNGLLRRTNWRAGKNNETGCRIVLPNSSLAHLIIQDMHAQRCPRAHTDPGQEYLRVAREFYKNYWAYGAMAAKKDDIMKCIQCCEAREALSSRRTAQRSSLSDQADEGVSPRMSDASMQTEGDEPYRMRFLFDRD